jgi:hypothetical protein
MPKGGEKVKTNELDKEGRAVAKNVLFRSVIVFFAFIITVTPLLCLQGVASADNGVVPIFLLGWAPGESTTYPTYKEYDEGWGPATTTLPAGMSVSGNYNEEHYVIEIPESYLGGDGATFYWAINVEATWPAGHYQQNFPADWGRWTGTNCHQDLVTSPTESWDEFDFSAQVFQVDLTRDWNGDNCRWTVDLGGITGHWSTGVQLVIAEDTSPPGGGCFIATAAYGTSTAAEIDVLRAFRDEVLLESTVGSQLVELYYQTSPPVADFISENSLLRIIVRELVINPMVSVATFTQGIWGK